MSKYLCNNTYACIYFMLYFRNHSQTLVLKLLLIAVINEPSVRSGSLTYRPLQPNPACFLFLQIWFIGMQPCLFIGVFTCCFYVTIVELSGWIDKINYWTLDVCSLSFYRKSWLIPALDHSSNSGNTLSYFLFCSFVLNHSTALDTIVYKSIIWKLSLDLLLSMGCLLSSLILLPSLFLSLFLNSFILYLYAPKHWSSTLRMFLFSNWHRCITVCYIQRKLNNNSKFNTIYEAW